MLETASNDNKKMSLRPREKKDPGPKHIEGKISFCKLLPNAENPYKERPSDVGLDVTLIGRTDNRSEDDTGEVNCFRTGIALTPPKGYYIEMVARSSLHKHGYMLATGTSIIDPEYTGELIVPLYKYKEAEDLELPFRAVQLLVKPAVYAHISMVKSLGETDRGVMGFGSSGFAGPSSMNQRAGAYIQDPMQAGYSGDMQGYQAQVQGYGRGVPRPHAAKPQSNHFF